MKTEIHQVSLGFNDCYIIRSKGAIMIDGGTRGEAFRKAMKRIPMEPSAIQLIVVTHGHLDHMDGLKESKS